MCGRPRSFLARSASTCSRFCLGGVTALLPVYARDILHVGPAVWNPARRPVGGRDSAGFVLAARPLKSRVGLKMFAAVGIYGLSTLVFAVSRSMALSVAALAILGAADMVSVFVRQKPRADRDPRSHARPRLRRVEPLHRRLERTGRIRIRRHGAPPRPRRLGDFRRLRRDSGDAAVGLVFFRLCVRPIGWNRLLRPVRLNAKLVGLKRPS